MLKKLSFFLILVLVISLGFVACQVKDKSHDIEISRVPNGGALAEAPSKRLSKTEMGMVLDALLGKEQILAYKTYDLDLSSKKALKISSRKIDKDGQQTLHRVMFKANSSSKEGEKYKFCRIQFGDRIVLATFDDKNNLLTSFEVRDDVSTHLNAYLKVSGGITSTSYQESSSIAGDRGVLVALAYEYSLIKRGKSYDFSKIEEIGSTDAHDDIYYLYFEFVDPTNIRDNE